MADKTNEISFESTRVTEKEIVKERQDWETLIHVTPVIVVLKPQLFEHRHYKYNFEVIVLHLILIITMLLYIICLQS